MDTANPKNNYDVIIVGAGPAGSTCALLLAKQKRKVLLIDKSVFPRDKVCGDAVSGKSINTIRELGLLEELSKQEHGVVEGVKLVAPNSNEVVVPFRKANGLDCAGYCVKRKTTDYLLSKKIKEHKSITFLQGVSVLKLIKNEQDIVIGVETQHNDNKQTYYAKVVVGADGSGSVVSREVGNKPNPPEHLYMGVRAYYDNVEGLEKNIELFFIDDVLPGYLWIFPIGDKKANVGLGILASDMKKRKIHPNTLLENAIKNSDKLKKRFSKATRDGNIGAWTIPLGSYKKKLCGNGWVLIGDSASLVDPFSGEGFGNATSSAKFCAQTINDIFASENEKSKNDNNESDIDYLTCMQLQKYAQKVETNLYPEMDITYKLQRAARVKFLLNMFIDKAATKPEFKQIVIDMLASNEQKKKVEDPLFYIKLLLP